MLFFEHLKKYKGVIHGILERKDGSVNPFSNSKTEENVLRALKTLGCERRADDLIFAEQMHTGNVFFCPRDTGGYIKLNNDGLVSETTGQILVVKTADCLPILMYDPKQQRVAAVHAGREGLVKEVIKEALKVLESRGEDLVVGIGPHIRKCCYRLKEKHQQEFQEGKWQKYIEKKEEIRYLDLTQIAIDQFEELGVEKENIEDMGICTFCQAERFFSTRKKEAEPNFYEKEDEKFPCFGSFIGLR